VSGFVRTVLGDVEPPVLGATYCHEHLITQPAARFGEDLCLDDEDRTAEELGRFRTSRLGEARPGIATCSRASSRAFVPPAATKRRCGACS
jgi:predicted metal-dependent phosphotriesterase family hydrolase